MADYALKLKENEVISIEREGEPGKFYRCLVMFVDSNDRPKLIVQDKYEAGLNRHHLNEYMRDNNLTQSMLAALLHVSRATMCRYLAGTRKIPLCHFKLLGIELIGSELQTQAHMENLHKIALVARELAKKLDLMIKRGDQQ